MDDLTEHWLPVVGWEGLYEVSDLGRVRSLPGHWRRPGIMRLGPTLYGYLRVELSVRHAEDDRPGHPAKRIRSGKLVHCLVAEAFIGPRPDGMEVRHLDGHGTNNLASNLAYGTPSENCLDMVRHGTHHKARVTHCPRNHEYTPENTYITTAGTRNCRECHRIMNRESARKSRARKRGEAA